MCIIVAKPAGVSLPDFKIFQNCFDNNPDGAGLMIAHDGKVRGRKGLMSIGEFKNALDHFEKVYEDLKNHTMVFHFRIGTHGTNSPANTHPFPLIPGGENYEAFKLLDWEADQGFAHNGIIYSLSSDPDVHKYDVSDTMVFGKKIALFFAECCDIPKSEGAQDILNRINSVSSNKFVFLDGEGNLFTMGTFEYKDGVAYSNSSYNERSWKRSSNTSRSNNYSSYGRGYYYYDDSGTPRWPSHNYPYGGNNVSYLNPANKSSSYGDESGSIKKSEKLKRAEEMGLTVLKKDAVVMCFDDIEDIDGMLCEKLKYAYSSTGILYYWNKVYKDWDLHSAPENGFALFTEDSNELIFNCLDVTDDDLLDICDGWFVGGTYLPESGDVK